MAGVDDEELVELVGQVLGLAHVVDDLADRPRRRHGDEVRLHQAAGGILRVFEAALQRDPLDRRDLREDLGLLLGLEVFEDRDRVVGFELADAFRHRLRRQLVEDLDADAYRRARSARRSRSRRRGGGSKAGRAPRARAPRSGRRGRLRAAAGEVADARLRRRPRWRARRASTNAAVEVGRARRGRQSAAAGFAREVVSSAIGFSGSGRGRTPSISPAGLPETTPPKRKSAAESRRFCFVRDENGAVEKTRTSTGCPTATSTLRVYQFRHDREKAGHLRTAVTSS